MSKKLVAYFSASGITAKVAEDLADAIGADIFEIRPEVPYTKADLNWMDKKSRSTIEMSNPDSRPAIAAKRDNMDEYDTIFVGFPIWWYIAPTIINTFLESYDLKNKTIIPFATSGGSDMGKTNEKLAPSCPGSKLLHNALNRTLPEVVRIRFHSQAVNANRDGFLLVLIELILCIISIVARQLQNAICNKVLTSTIRFHDCFNQILRHIGIVCQQLLGVLGQAIPAARCQVLDNFFHK